MRKKLITRFFMTVAVIASLVLNAGSVFATNGVVRSQSVVSPYWQSDSGSYTYIGITHPSLSGMASSIGLKVTANNLAGSAVNTATFTVSVDSTAKLFIVATNASSYSTLNSTNLPTSNFMVNTSGAVAGELVITPVASNPSLVSGTDGNSNGFRDVTMLSMWGAIVAASTSTGFAMEFIGDLADSHNPVNGAVVSAGVN